MKASLIQHWKSKLLEQIRYVLALCGLLVFMRSPGELGKRREERIRDNPWNPIGKGKGCERQRAQRNRTQEIMGRSQSPAQRVWSRGRFISNSRKQIIIYFRYRQREGGVVKSVLAESQVCYYSSIFSKPSKLNSTKVVIATCHSAGSRQLVNDEFDVVIIDEATQATEAVRLSSPCD